MSDTCLSTAKATIIRSVLTLRRDELLLSVNAPIIGSAFIGRVKHVLRETRHMSSAELSRRNLHTTFAINSFVSRFQVSDREAFVFGRAIQAIFENDWKDL